MRAQHSAAQLSLLPYRVCSRCGEEKQLTDFPIMRSGRDGRKRWCKRCEAARIREYYAKFPERKQASARRDYERHGESIRSRVRRYAAENAEAVRARKRDYYAQNKDRWIGIGAARKRRISRIDEDAQRYVGALIGDRCCYCGSRVEHIDHIVPVARGGANDWDNLTAACEACNRAKHANPLLLFLLYRRPGKAIRDITRTQNP